MIRRATVTLWSRSIVTLISFILLLSHSSAQMAPGDEFWDNRFTRAGGVDGLVNDVVQVNDNDLFVVGSFSLAGVAHVNSVARFDRSVSQWSDVDGGVRFSDGSRGIVYSAVWHDGMLYVAGAFDSAGGTAAANIARWDGAGWSSIATGTDAPVRALAVNGEILYAGGGFSMAGGVPVRNVARWSTVSNTWSAVGDGPNSAVYALAVDEAGVLYAGGIFTGCGDSTTNHVASWDGIVWGPLGSDPDSNGVDALVLALAVDGDRVYAAGDFARAGGRPANRIAWWNSGSGEWTPLDTGESDGGLRALVVGPQGDLFVAGDITRLAKLDTPRVARWRRSAGSWFALDDGLDGVAIALDISATTLFVAGMFTQAGAVAVSNVALWDLSTEGWGGVGGGVDNGVDGTVYAVAYDSRYLYVGGTFTRVAGITAMNIARWDSWNNTWSPLGDGVRGGGEAVYALAMAGDVLYIGGDFVRAGGMTIRSAASWATQSETWGALGAGIASSSQPVVRALRVGADGRIYVGGRFEEAGGGSAGSIAIFDPANSSWSIPDSGVDGTINAIAVASDGRLFVGGSFTRAGGIDAVNIARWSGTVWSALAGGTDKGTRGDVLALALRGDSLIVGGSFVQAGAVLAGGLALWNDRGMTWHVLDTNVREGSIVHACAIGGGYGGGDVYCGGEFGGEGSTAPSNVARWRGLTQGLESLGSGIDGPVYALTARDNELFAGGAFSLAGGSVSWRVGRWSGGISEVLIPGETSAGSKRHDIQVDRDGIRVTLAPGEPGPCRISLHTLFGTLVVPSIDTDLQSIWVSTAGCPSGPYFLHVASLRGSRSIPVYVIR